MFQPILRRLGPAAVQVVLRRSGSSLRFSHMSGGRPSPFQVSGRFGSPFGLPVATVQNHVRSIATRRRAAEAPIQFRHTTITTPPRRPRRIFQKLVSLLGGLGLTAYAADRFYLGSVVMRSARAYGTMALVGLDYKLHLGNRPYVAGVPLETLHDRNARRVCDMLKRNGGLYLKAGQAVAMQAGGVLPEAYQRAFSETFDDAARAPWADVEAVVRGDFGRSVEQVFGADAVEREPRAAASIAQVHYGRLSDGREVAIKVQRRQIAAQVSSDLSTLKRMIEYTAEATSIPMDSLGGFVMDHVMQETDFENERANAERLAGFVRDDPRLRDRVHIPVVYPDLSSKRVLTTEWIHGRSLWDKDGITAPYTSTPSDGGLGLGLRDVMETVVELFSAQMFRYGFVHCDPHPGNILVRRTPSGKPEIVLLDHGLYVTLSDNLRRQYALFWKALLTQDAEGLKRVSRAWGMEDPAPWADALAMRSGKQPGPPRGEETAREREERMIAEAAGYFGEDGLWPPELVFLERNLGLVQGSNRHLGSPVNRVKMVGAAAMRAVAVDGQGAGRREPLWERARSRWSLFLLDLAFCLSSVRQYFGYGGGFEEDLKEEEDRSARELKDALAVVLGVAVD
ncbi:abc1 domain protein [Colletotrichum tabaci]|uniref:Abc1 domain protein n=1 Tax=Colletotrichum tabaci TaxID=1209068 RepID=A0AAV9TK02_9PEZI